MKEIIVIIPIYRNYLEEFEIKSLNINLTNLKSYDKVFIAPIKLKFDILFCDLLKRYNIDVVYFSDIYFNDIVGYNKLMLSYEFYKYFERYNYILICQLDALVLSNNLDCWVSKGFDYVGAPFIFQEGDNYYFNLMGNGGLSLRKISKFLEVLESKFFYFSNFKYYSISTSCGLRNIILVKFFHKLSQLRIGLNSASAFLFFFNINEDYFWAFFAKFFVSKYDLPSSLEALSFSFDENPRKCFSIAEGKLPFGCHAWQKYDRKFWEEVYPKLLL